MSEIKVGDLVYIDRPWCCSRSAGRVGYVYRVVALKRYKVSCTVCGKKAVEVLAYGLPGYYSAYFLSCLKKIEPPPTTINQTEDMPCECS